MTLLKKMGKKELAQVFIDCRSVIKRPTYGTKSTPSGQTDTTSGRTSTTSGKTSTTSGETSTTSG